MKHRKLSIMLILMNQTRSVKAFRVQNGTYEFSFLNTAEEELVLRVNLNLVLQWVVLVAIVYMALRVLFSDLVRLVRFLRGITTTRSYHLFEADVVAVYNENCSTVALPLGRVPLY